MILAAFALMLGTQDGGRWEVLRARIESAPKDVAAFIERRSGCNHFWGEVGSEYAERERQVQDALKELRCNQLEADEHVLRKRHRDKPELLDLLDDTVHLMPW